MALTKAAATLTAAITTSQTTTGVSVAADYAPGVYWNLVQVGTATTAATFNIQASPDAGTTWYDLTGPVAAGTVAATYTGVVDVPMSATQVRVVFVQQAGGTSSTFSAQLGEVTAL